MIIHIKKVSDNLNKWVDGAGLKDGVLGYIKDEPKIGLRLSVFYAEHQDSLLLITTPVKRIQFDGGKRWTVFTENSEYQILKIADGGDTPEPQMDEVDRRQQRELDANRARDDHQQNAIEKLQDDKRLLFLILVINTVASLAQILECWKVWTRGGL